MKLLLNRRRFLPLLFTLTTVIPKFIHPSHLQILNNVWWMNEGSPRADPSLWSGWLEGKKEGKITAVYSLM
jgi:hypothetical protein